MTNLEAFSKRERNAYLSAVSKEVTLEFGPGYYREYKKPEISYNKCDSIEADFWGVEIGTVYYSIKYPYDPEKEKLNLDFTARVIVMNNTGQPVNILFGNGYGFKLSDNWRERSDLGSIPYQQVVIFPIYDWQNGKNETNSDPVNVEELKSRGFEKQADGKWVKVHPDVPPKY